MRTSICVAMFALLACADPVSPSAPQPSESVAPSASASAPTPTLLPSATPASELAYAPPSGWSVVAKLTPEEQLRVFPLDDGDALLVAVPLKGSAAPRFAKLLGDSVSWAPELSKGLPPSAFAGEVLVAGRMPDKLWIASGSPCVVRQWEAGEWKVREPSTPLKECSQLSTWLPGAAIAAGDGKDGLTLAAYGKVPKTLPLASSAPKKLGASTCTPGPLSAAYYQLRGFETGELLAVGGSVSCRGDSVLERWSSGSAKSVAASALVDTNSPIYAVVRSKDEVYLEGVTYNTKTNELEQSAVTHTFDGKGKLVSSSKPLKGLNRLEDWLTGAPEAAGFSKGQGGDGFDYQSFVLAPASGDIYVFGAMLKGAKPVETLVLRNRPVKSPLSTSSPTP